MKNNKKNLLIKLFIFLFGLSVSMTVIPCGMVNSYGLFGEMQSVIITEADRAGREEISTVSKKCHNFKGINIYNIWFEIATVIIYLIFVSYKFRLPREETIITLKFRLDN